MTHPDFSGVLDLLGRYYDGLYRCDVPLLAQVFSESALYATTTENGVLTLSMQEYLPRVAARTPPADLGTPYGYEVESIDLAGPNTAMARLRCSLFGNDYIDLLSLVRVEGAWRIQAKVFHATPQLEKA